MNNQTKHKGQIIKKAVYSSGIKITELARRINKSRRFIYVLFDNSEVPLHYIEQIGNAIHYDFSNDISGIDKAKVVEMSWKDKYFKLLEEHNELLKKYYEK